MLKVFISLTAVFYLASASARSNNQIKEVLESLREEALVVIENAIAADYFPKLEKRFKRVYDILDEVNIRMTDNGLCQNGATANYNHLKGINFCPDSFNIARKYSWSAGQTQEQYLLQVMIHEASHGTFMFPNECKVSIQTIRIMEAAGLPYHYNGHWNRYDCYSEETGKFARD